MTIKEVERILEVPKATIRFYEKEGLINPQRGENKYREYFEEDVERLKKIIVFRKVGLGVEEIRKVLNNESSLQEALVDNISKLENQMQEIKGAIKVCELMQSKQEDIYSFDEEYYWDIIHAEEKHGNKFFEIVNDIVEFEKKVVLDEFGLADEEGKIKVSPLKAVAIVICTCLLAGFMWFFLDEMNIRSFGEGVLSPFACVILTSILGLPLYFLEKNNAKAARIIKTIGKVFFVLLLIAVVLMMIFLEV